MMAQVNDPIDDTRQHFALLDSHPCTRLHFCIFHQLLFAVHFRNRERITFDHLVSMKKPNETVNIRVLRDGIEHEFSVTLQPVSLEALRAHFPDDFV